MNVTWTLVCAVMSVLPVTARPAENPKPIAGEFSVRRDRPRLYLNAGDIEKLRKRIASTHQDEWRSVMRARESQDLTQRMLAGAFSYQIDRNRTHARRAIDAALELAGKDLDRVDDDLGLAYRVWPEGELPGTAVWNRCLIDLCENWCSLFACCAPSHSPRLDKIPTNYLPRLLKFLSA